ncbi:MAG: hypothetical protein WDN69_14945 [Aliidongia sp.]
MHGSVAVDGADNVFFTVAQPTMVGEILAAGGYTVVNTLGSGFSHPQGVAVDGSGNVFIADTGNNAIKEILAAGGYTSVIALAAANGDFSAPQGIAVDGSGNVFVADTGNNVVKEIVAAGGYTTVTTLASGFNGPAGVAVDGNGDVFVADQGNAAVGGDPGGAGGERRPFRRPVRQAAAIPSRSPAQGSPARPPLPSAACRRRVSRSTARSRSPPRVPAGTVGTADVTVTAPGGTSATGISDRYTYLAVPTVSAITPTGGSIRPRNRGSLSPAPIWPGVTAG